MTHFSETTTVLYIEDIKPLARLVRNLLELKGYSVSLAYDGREGVVKYSENAYDIIIVDQYIPYQNGLDVIREMLKLGPIPPTIMVTGTGDETIAVEAMKLGAADYIVKDPSNSFLDLLPSVIEQALNQHRLTLENRRMVEELKRSEQRYRRLFEQSSDAIFIHDLNGIIQNVNHRACEILDYPHKQLLTMTMDELHSNKTVESALEAYGSIKEEGEVRFESLLSKVDGKIINVEICSRMIDSPKGNVQTVIRDITVQKQMQQQIHRASKMSAIGRLAGEIAHNFNNYLTIIGGRCDLIEAKFPEDYSFKEDIVQIQKVVESATELTGQILAVSSKQFLLPKLLNLNDIVENLKTMFSPLISDGISLTTVPEPNLSTIRADKGQLEQVILNLMVNARDAMPKGGQLILETSNVELDQNYASMHMDVEPGSYVLLTVSDTGIGMDEYTKSRIFEPFFTTKGNDKGTGLGLAAVFGVVKQSGGYVWVYSELGNGTTFKIYLPKANQLACPTTPTPKKILNNLSMGTETILVVEDNERVRNLTVIMLNRLGYSVLQAENGESALNVSHSYKDPIHLLLCDVILPDKNGIDVVASIREIHTDTKVLHMSGYTNNMVVLNKFLDAETGFIQKPFTLLTLSKKVREVLDY